jgi:hypothetical protein
MHPSEGTNALALYRIADERLYARKLMRGQRRGILELVRDPPAKQAGPKGPWLTSQGLSEPC